MRSLEKNGCSILVKLVDWLPMYNIYVRTRNLDYLFALAGFWVVDQQDHWIKSRWLFGALDYI